MSASHFHHIFNSAHPFSIFQHPAVHRPPTSSRFKPATGWAISIYSTYRKDRRYSTNISYRSCHFGGPKSTNHIEDNACCKSCPKQVFGGFQPHFLGIIFYMVCKWQLPFNINNSLVFTVFLAILTKLFWLLLGKCMYAQMPVCCQSSSTLAGFGGEVLQQACWNHLGKRMQKTPVFLCFFGADVKVIPRKNRSYRR